MSRYFTHYWTNDTWKENQEDYEGDLFEYTSGNQFGKKGVGEGDTVYAITVSKGDLYLCGKMVVGVITNKNGAARRLGGDPYNAKEHLFASRATRMSYDKKVPVSLVQKLRFIDAQGSKPPIFIGSGKLHKQTLRGIRELDSRSASLLDSELPALSSVADNQEAFTDSSGDNEDSQNGPPAKKGAGFGNPEMNTRVEQASIEAVKSWYTSRGWRVVDRQKENLGYDLLFIKRDAEEYVEVKGVQGEDPSFPITSGEVNYARRNPRSKIVVVISALSRNRRLLFYSGPEIERVFKLQPLAYRASLRVELKNR